MTNEERKINTVEGFYGSQWFAALPFILFVISCVVLSFKGLLSMELWPALTVGSWIAGSFFAKNKSEYWDMVVAGMSEPANALVVGIFLLAGIYSKLMGMGRVAEGLIWVGSKLHLGGGISCMFTYIISALFGIATGTSFGTVVTMVPVLYPAAVGLGANPVFAAAAILSGAATGDHLAPVSDTTIITASSQKYRRKTGSAEIGEVVKARLRHVIPVAIITCVLYLVFGSGAALDSETASKVLQDFSYQPGLYMLLPLFVVLGVAMSGRTIFESLTCGILSGVLVGSVTGILKLSDFFYISDTGSLTGIIPLGVQSMFPVCVATLTFGGNIGLLKQYGLINDITSKLSKGGGNTPKAIETVMFWMTTAMNFLLLGNTTGITLVVGPINDEVGSIAKIHPYRRANLSSGVANSLGYFMPWHSWPLYVIGGILPILDKYPFIPIPKVTDFLFSTFYPLLIWVFWLIAVMTGFDRQFEGRNGKVVTTGTLFSNEIPAETLE